MTSLPGAALRGRIELDRLEPGAAAVRSRLDAFLALPVAGAIQRARALAQAHPAALARDSVQLFAPLYLASPCANDCTYCGFRRSSKAQRSMLGPAELLAEAGFLVDQGHRSIDLVTGEIPRDVFVDYVARSVELIRARTPIQRIHLNLGALSTAQYRRLRDAGAVGYHLYQETYDPEVYRRVHAGGPKSDLAHRLDAPERALDAGFEFLGLGVLLGLTDFAGDLSALVAHARELARRHPAAHLGFSLPRMQNLSAGRPDRVVRVPEPVGDKDFVKSMLFLAAEFPDAHLTLTTREPPSIRDLLLPLCITKASAGVSVRPGGYSGDHDADAQFEIRDTRSLSEIAALIAGLGKRVAYG